LFHDDVNRVTVMLNGILYNVSRLIII
jgi:hypothetical protein